jgi:hypothetical protein
MVTKTPAELAEMRADVEAGKLPKNAIEQYYAGEEKAVFGHDVKHDRHKNPIEQGIGSPGHETLNHFKAIRTYEGEDAYHAACAQHWKDNPEHAAKLKLPKAAPPKPAAAGNSEIEALKAQIAALEKLIKAKAN